MDICFHIPDFTNHFRLNTLLIDSIKTYPEWFHDGLKIASVFGCFHGCVWNGGRLMLGNADIETIKYIVNSFNESDIPLRFTFTNPIIDKNHIGDSMGNQILRVGNNGFNEVIVVSPILEEYIRENYPNYPITSSTCKQIENIDELNEELKMDYKYVVLDYNLNNKFDLLEKIAPEKRAKCEVLINACCVPACPRRGEHYHTIGQEQIKEWEYKKNLLNKKPYVPDNIFECDSTNRSIYDISVFSTYVSPEDIFEKYLPMGFNQFKIEGRTIPDIYLLETYIHYMVKPELKDKIRLLMLQKLANVKYFKG